MDDKLLLRPCPQCGAGCEIQHQYCPGCGFPIGAVSASNEDRLVGRALPGGYQILDLLSVGGMGRVYRAEQRALGRTVAVKVIDPRLLADENSITRFMTEARAASQLNHPNSVSVIDFGKTEEGQPYLVMEFLRGKDLGRIAYEQGPLSFKRIVDVLRQALLALAEAHHLGIIHRDLKPENIFLEPLRRGGDFVKVIDFGLAKLKADTAAPSVTLPGIVCGTPDYMAPEQGRGDAIDGRGDLYAVGAILFQLLTGRLPFESENPTQVVMMHLTAPVPDPRQIAPERDIPDSLVRVTFKALSKDPRERYQDALEFADALQSAIDEMEAITPRRQTERPSTTVQCPSCGASVASSHFCGECGARLPIQGEEPALSQLSLTLPLKFVGCDEDLAWLNERRQLANNQVIGARIVGEMGTGKTRLLQEFCARSRSLGDHVVSVGPDPHWAEVAYYALNRAVAQLARFNGRATEEVLQGAEADVRRGLQDIAGFGSKNDGRSPQNRRRDLAQALRWALFRAAMAAGKQRVILAVDDLHRIDGSSRSAFADALGEPPSCGALIVATHTPGFESGWAALHAARVISGMSSPLVTRILQSSGVGTRLASGMHIGMRGVPPLYLEQALRFASDGGTEPPARLADLVAHRIGTFEPQLRRVLQAIAVLGDSVEPGLIHELVPTVENLDDCLKTLTEQGMIEVTDGKVSLQHPLFHEIVLMATPVEVRRDLHARAVELFDRHQAPIEARALHAYYAQESLGALLLLEQVAERALLRGDERTAVTSLRRGLDLARQEIYRGELDDPMHAVAIFGRKLGDALTQAGSFSDAEGALREALDMAGPTGSDRARVLASLARLSHERKRGDEALAYIDQAIETARQSGAHDLLSSLTTTRSTWAS